MKLLRYGPIGQEKPGVLDAQGRIRDLSEIAPDFGGATVSLKALDALRAADVDSLPVVEGDPRIGSCVSHAPTFHCVGLNYGLHADETGNPRPPEPVLFNKAASALSGPNDSIIRPKGSTRLDYEVELGVIIGETVEHVSEADALKTIAGYCVVNDVSERTFQVERGGQWVKGKSAPTFAPTGPQLVTTDEIPDPQNLAMSLQVNGAVRQSSNTSDMIFSVAEVISYMSRFMRLVPGDVIATGTPQGVAAGMTPRGWLVPGDAVRLTIAGLGEQAHSVVDYPG